MDDERRRLIKRYKEGHRVITEAPGERTPRQVVHHLADSEMTSAIRLRRLVADDRPVIHGYDQEEFARRLYYDRRIAASLATVDEARSVNAQLLDCLTATEWAREGTHSESGSYAVDNWLRV